MENDQLTPLELTKHNQQLAPIFQRYGIEPSSNKALAYAVGNPQFLLGLLEGAANPDQRKASAFEQFPIQDIVEFLFRSHDYYQNKRLPEISLSIENLYMQSETGLDILNTIQLNFEDFCKHLIYHFKEEETTLFKIALEKEANQTATSLNFGETKAQHQEIHTVNFIDLILQYLNLFQASKGTQLYKDVLIEQLEALKLDFELHEWIEEEVLIPKIM